MSKSLRE